MCEMTFFGRRNPTRLRNASMPNYVDAICYLISNGFSVVRVAGPEMQPFKKMEFFGDYARSCAKSAENDIVILCGAEFHIGCSSGLSVVPLLSGIPTLFVNWWPLVNRSWGQKRSRLEST